MIIFDLRPSTSIIRAGIVRGGQEGRIPAIRRFIAAILIWLSVASPVAAQSAGGPERWAELADTIFRNYGPDDGLPISSVTAYAEDGDGFLWVGTSSGLARWDGYHFRVYHKDPKDPRSLQDDFIWCLRSDGRGRLWIGTNGGVARYDRSADKFVMFAVDSSGQKNVPVRALAEDDTGGMWAGTDHGLVHLSSDGHLLDAPEHGGSAPTNRPTGAIGALLRDHAGGLWVGTDEGVFRRSGDASGFTPVPLAGAGAEKLAIRALFESRDGRIWMGTRNHGLYGLSPSAQLAQPVRGAPGSDLEHLTIQSIAEGRPGEMWLGTDGKGVVVFDPAEERTRQIRHDSARATSLPHDYIFSLYRDHSGLLWAGTYSGMGFTDPTQNGVLTVFGGSNQTQGLSGADILSTLAAADGKIWVTYLAGGADILDPAGHRSSSLRHDPSHPSTSLPPERVRAINQAQNGDVYLGTYRGLYRYGGKSGVSHLPVSPTVPNPAIFSLLSEGAGLWIGTRGDGLWWMDSADGKSRRRAADVLTTQWISAIASAGDGRLWVGSYQGLYLFDPSSEQIRQVLPDPQDTNSRSGVLISSLLKDRRGRIWVSPHDGEGIAVIEMPAIDQKPRIRRIGTADGLTDLNVDALLEDPSGVIWGSTSTGLIVRIDPNTLKLGILQRAEGVGIRSFAWNAGSSTAQGELLFGGDGGLTVVRPDRLKSWDWRPPVVVTDLSIGDRQVPPQTLNGAGEKIPMEIGPKANSLSIEFAALDYSAPDRNRYAYRLEGYDKSWVQTDATRRLASYTNLPPGHYNLQLRGTNRDGKWTENALDIPIRVIPDWYQTIQFRIVLGGLAVFGIWLLVRSRTAYLRHRQRILENQVAERTAELQQSNSQLEVRTAELAQSVQEIAESRAKVASLLDTSGQGFLSFGADLIVERDYSRACVSMLGEVPVGRRANEILFPGNASQAELFREVVSGALASADAFKRDLLLSLLPVVAERFNRLLKLEYRPLENSHLMVVLTDVTEERRLSRRVESERSRLAMIVAAVTESRDFFDAIESFRQFFRQDLMSILAARAEPLAIHQEISRQIHTFKGMLAQFNFEATPQALNELEERLSVLRRAGEGMSVGHIVELVLSVDFHGTLETDLTILRNALGEEFLDHGKRVLLPISQARKLRTIAERLVSGDALDVSSAELRELFEEFRNLDKISLADALAVYDHTVNQVAKRLDKEVSRLSIDGGEDLWLDPELYGPFLRTLVHVFRNAVVHGIEDPEERLAAGKDSRGRVECVIRVAEGGFTLAIADDGAGIDAAALRGRAVSLGLVSQQQAEGLSEEDAVALIFEDMVSARKQVDELAGRGIGLAAVRAETRTLGGEVSVTSIAGRGTRFLFSLPFLARQAGSRPTDMTGA